MTEGQEAASAVPQGVPRFNWGAFFFPPLWPLVYGLPGWSFVAVATQLLLLVMSNGLTQDSPSDTVYLVIGLQEAVTLGLRVYYGLNITAAYWQRHPERMSAADYTRRQPKWATTGALIMVAYLALNVYLLRTGGLR